MFADTVKSPSDEATESGPSCSELEGDSGDEGKLGSVVSHVGSGDERDGSARNDSCDSRRLRGV